MSKVKQYVRGSAKEKVFDNGSSLVNFSINIKDQVILDNVDEKGWVQLVISSKRVVDAYGNSHYIYLNDFVPTKQEVKPETKEEKDELPF